jgi:hypothetical protein
MKKKPVDPWPGEGTLAKQRRCGHQRQSWGRNFFSGRDAEDERRCLDCQAVLETRVHYGKGWRPDHPPPNVG